MPYAFASHFATAHLFEALKIYREEFQPSEALTKPYTMAGVNIVIAETDEVAERMATSLLRMIVGIFTNKRQPLQAPTEMTSDLQELSQHPAVHQMMKYSFIGSKASVKKQVKEFLEKTEVDELIAVSHMYDADDRVKSYQWFAEIMKELNTENHN